MWDGIAQSQLGSTSHTDRLMNANLKHLKYYLFPAGVVLNLPEITVNASSMLPPWKQAAG